MLSNEIQMTQWIVKLCRVIVMKVQNQTLASDLDVNTAKKANKGRHKGYEL